MRSAHLIFCFVALSGCGSAVTAISISRSEPDAAAVTPDARVEQDAGRAEDHAVVADAALSEDVSLAADVIPFADAVEETVDASSAADVRSEDASSVDVVTIADAEEGEPFPIVTREALSTTTPFAGEVETLVVRIRSSNSRPVWVKKITLMERVEAGEFIGHCGSAFPAFPVFDARRLEEGEYSEWHVTYCDTVAGSLESRRFIVFAHEQSFDRVGRLFRWRVMVSSGVTSITTRFLLGGSLHNGRLTSDDQVFGPSGIGDPGPHLWVSSEACRLFAISFYSPVPTELERGTFVWSPGLSSTHSDQDCAHDGSADWHGGLGADIANVVQEMRR